MTAPLVGIDLGGTKLLGVAVDPGSHRIVATHRVPTPQGGAAVVDAISSVVAHLAATLDQEPLAVGVGAAALVDPSGVLRFAPNVVGVDDLDLVGALQPRLGTTVRVDNDATCGALAELLVGSARGTGTTLVVALGTGIGGGLIIDGRLWRGAHRMAGEVGHLLVDPSGPECGCGRRGCWEQMASGNALGRLARQAAAQGRAPSLLELAGALPDGASRGPASRDPASRDPVAARVTGVHVTEAAAAGRPDALAVLDEFARWVAVGLAGLVNVCDPELVVVGGGLSESGPLLLDPVARHLNTLVMGAGHRPAVPVVAATAGEAAAALGAALLAGADDPWGRGHPG